MLTFFLKNIEDLEPLLLHKIIIYIIHCITICIIINLEEILITTSGGFGYGAIEATPSQTFSN